jgi:hypothetical protein
MTSNSGAGCLATKKQWVATRARCIVGFATRPRPCPVAHGWSLRRYLDRAGRHSP